MAKPKPQRKKRVAKKKGQGSRLPKAVSALLSYLSGPGTGAPTIQQTPARFASAGEADKSFATQVAEAVVARQVAQKSLRLKGAEPLKSSPISAFSAPAPPQQPQQPQTIVIQQPESSEKQTEEIRKTVMKETGGIEGRLTEQLRLQGINQLFKTMREQGSRPLGSLLRTSQAPSYLGRSPSGIESIATSEDVGSVASAGQFPVITAETLAQYQQEQYGKSLATAKLPPAKILKGRAPRAAKAPKGGAAKAPEQQSFTQSLGGLASMAQLQAPVSSASSASAPKKTSARSRNIYEQLTGQGLSAGGDIVQAMASGGGPAPEQVGMTLGELKKKPKARRMKFVEV
jgi:hypothetical protein